MAASSTVAVAERNFGLAFMLAPWLTTGLEPAKEWEANEPTCRSGTNAHFISFPSLALSRSGSRVFLTRPNMTFGLGPLAICFYYLLLHRGIALQRQHQSRNNHRCRH